jgi:hypothetical protein
MGGEKKKGSEERPRRRHFRIPVRRMKPWDQGRETRHRTKNPVGDGVCLVSKGRRGVERATKKGIMRCKCRQRRLLCDAPASHNRHKYTSLLVHRTSLPLSICRPSCLLFPAHVFFKKKDNKRHTAVLSVDG